MSLRTLFVLGTRPEAIKLAPVIGACLRDPDFEVRLCDTGQHRSLVAPVLDAFGIRPDHRLDLMREDQDLTLLAARVLRGVRRVLRQDAPALVVVQGDTTTCLAAALAAFHERIPVAHVESGLRTGDPRNPHPEETNRRLVDALAHLCFAPTETERANLLREGVPADRVRVTGNTVVDALRATLSRLDAEAASGGRGAADPGAALGLDPGRRLVLVTMHRRESFGRAMRGALRGVRRIAREHPDVEVLVLVHPNPHVERAVAEVLEGADRIHLSPPVDYPRAVALLARSHLVLTDSGGIQEEAAALGTPVLVLRACTERVEGIAEGVAYVVGTDEEDVAGEAGRILRDPLLHARMARASDRYGDGRATGRIVEALKKSRLG